MSFHLTSNSDRGAPDSVAAGCVLVIDDEPDLRTLYELSLTREGYQVFTAGTVQQALQALRERSFHAIVSDMQLPDGLGLEVLKFLSTEQRHERCVVITAHGSAENAVEALKSGAFDYLTKPVDLKQFRSVISQAVRLGQSHAVEQPVVLAETLQAAKSSAAGSSAVESGTELSDKAEQALGAIVGSSDVMRQLRARIEKVARSMAPVLVHGESGTGKELVARAVHACSHRADGPFVAVNCGAIPEHLLEAEFFGARKGSYTGATMDRVGLFQAAQGGTLFLDEIGDLPLAMQAKLLRAIQERSVRALGDTTEQSVNVRIVSATHRDLPGAVAAQQFRQDLFYRINVIDLVLPPLRQRVEDLAELVHCLLARIAADAQLPTARATPIFLAQLQSMQLPGNVRELENLLHRAVALSDGEELSLDALGTPSAADTKFAVSQANAEVLSAPKLQAASSQLPRDLQAHLDEQERQIIAKALQETGFNRTTAAARLGMSLRQIRYRMARLGIADEDEKS